MICKVRKTLTKFSMLEDTDEIIVGFSGGADSLCLLHVLNSIKSEFSFRLHAAHVNHCLRGEESDRDEKFVRDFCESNNIVLSVLRVNIHEKAEEYSMSIEECGRKVRYDFFNSLCDEKSKIATAHNLNDCEETFLFNFARGTTINGLASIPAKRENIIRPIIECTRDEIELYCKENNLSFVTDSSNLTDEYTRNKIRHNIIPVLKEINNSFDSAALRCISSIREDNDFITNEANNIYNKAVLDSGFDSEIIRNAHPSLRNRVISRIIKEKCGVVPEKRHIDLVCEALSGGKVELFDRETLVVRNGRLYFLSDVEHRDFITEKIRFDNCNSWSNNYISCELSEICPQKVYKELVLSTLDYDKIVGDLIVRKRQDGDKISLPVRKVTKSLKKLFNEMDISPEERDNILVIADEKSVVWIENVGADLRVAPTKNSKHFFNISVLGNEYD